MLPLDPGTLARGREGMKKGQTHGYMDSEARIRWSSLTYHCNPEPQCTPANGYNTGEGVTTADLQEVCEGVFSGLFCPSKRKVTNRVCINIQAGY